MKLFINQATFGDLISLGEYEYRTTPKGRQVLYEKVKCICGKEYFCQRQHLTRGDTVNCGCKRVERARNLGYKNITHGMQGTIFYKKYHGIVARCNNPNNHAFNYYGGRGIKCEWNNFIDFKNDMYDSYCLFCQNNPGVLASIERIDVNGNYSKENCTWIDISDQTKNTRAVVKVEYKGETKILSDWCRIFQKKFGGNDGILKDRISWGWSFEKAFTTPVEKKLLKSNLFDNTESRHKMYKRKAFNPY